MTTYYNFINGEFVPHKGDFFEVLNPANKEVISKVASASLDDVQRAIGVAKKSSKILGGKTSHPKSKSFKRNSKFDTKKC